MSSALSSNASTRVSAEESAAHALRDALRSAGISVLVRGGPEVFAESGRSWVAISSHLKEEEAATLAALIRKGLGE